MSPVPVDPRARLRCDFCHQYCTDWTAIDGGVVIVCAPCFGRVEDTDDYWTSE